MTKVTEIDINDYIDCLLMDKKEVTLENGVISGCGFKAKLDVDEGEGSEFNGAYTSHVIQVEGKYVVSLIAGKNPPLVVYAGSVHK
jgi:hypothetical protein